MAEIRLAANLISNDMTGDTGLGHFQMVLYNSQTSQFEIEVQAPTWWTIPLDGDWVFPELNRPHFGLNTNGHPYTPNYGEEFRYEYTTLNIGERSADSVWALLREVHRQFSEQADELKIDYDINYNSNSYATALMYLIGFDIMDFVEQTRPDEVVGGFLGIDDPFPGVGVNPLFIENDAPSFELIGSEDGDIIRVGFGEDTLSGLAGNDELLGGEAPDTLVGGSGNDTLDGQEGGDLVDYSGTEGVVDAAIDDGIVAALTEVTNPAPNQNTFSVQVTDSWGWTDTLLNVERIAGTAHDDSFALNGNLAEITADLQELDAGGDGALGDTLDLSGVTDASGAMINLQQGFIQSNDDNLEAAIITEFENVIGTGQNDFIIGDGQDNLIEGGAGADMIDGGGGIDVVHFDMSGAGVTIDLLPAQSGSGLDGLGTGGDAEGDVYSNVEVFIGTEFSDEFTINNSEVPEPILIAGGAGDDRLVLSDLDDDHAPVVFWGGAGADEVIDDDFFNSMQVMIVNIPNVSEDNYHLFTLDMLGLGPNFNWEMIDVIIVNPDADDRLVNAHRNLGDEYDISVGMQTHTFVTGGTYDASPQPNEITETVTFFGLDVAPNQAALGGQSDDVVSTYSVDFGSQSYSVFGQIASLEINEISVLLDDGEPTETVPGSFDYTGISTNIFPGGDDTSEYQNYFWIDYDCSPTGGGTPLITDRSEWGHRGYDDLSDIPTYTEDGSLQFFVLGGELNGATIVSDNQFSVTLPDPEGASGPRDPDPGSNGSNFGVSPGGSGTTRTYSGFSTGQNILVLSGVPLDPNSPAADIALQQSGDDVLISTSSGDIVLADTDLAAWQTATDSHILGTSGDDETNGTSAGELISTGTGNDTIDANSGDDTISYASGDDWINGDDGHDTLDLSQYNSDQLSFRIEGHDVFIDTPDGTIELDYQVRYEIGHDRSNIETLILADATFTDADIRQRALDDQNTSGDDNITGSLNDDAMTTSSGNDTLDAKDGNDTISYVSGDDQIIGGTGDDTLDLSQYNSDEVTFHVGSAHDILITTPDGTIELHYQVRYEIGHDRSNIETVVLADATLTDADIRQRALDDQNTPGDDSIAGTLNADIMTTSAGNDTLDAWAGDDIISYVSGDDQIVGGTGNDTLDLSQYSADQVTFRVGEAHDIFIDTPDGTIELHYQVRYGIGDTKTNIETLVFSDITLDDAGVRDRALADQVTTGDDEIVGTLLHGDILTTGAGDDVVTGFGGADVFTFAPGDGADTIADFEDGTDLIRITGGPTNFSELAITDINGNAVVSYDGNDSITFTGVSASLLSHDSFEFV